MLIQIRRANPNEAESLTAIAHAAKRHWGYPESWIERWTSDLAITPDFIANNEVFVAVNGGKIVGCCALVLSDSVAELEHMWINPPDMANGIGRALFTQVKERARHLRIPALELSADPNAEGFYERMGAKRIGEVRADMDSQRRVLPRMRIELGVAPSGGHSSNTAA